MKVRSQADADLKHAIVSATLRREPTIDFRSAPSAGGCRGTALDLVGIRSGRMGEPNRAPASLKTRVMAALRERRLSPEASALIRMWRAAGALASSMVALVMILAVVTVFTTGPDSLIQPMTAPVSQNIYSPEYVVFEQGDLPDDLTYDEAAATMYELEDYDGQ